MAGTSKVIDWGEQQSSLSSGFASTTDLKPVHPGPRRMARTYSIPTLLKLGQIQQPPHIELRISPAALAESVFKVASAAPRSKLQENLHPRRQTQSSNITGRSTNSEEDALYNGTYIRPIRQPYNPPEISLIQKHQGFARFLKQHASPPHHRVTAGGRIVPAGPLAPPPMMFLPSISAVVSSSSELSAAKPQGDLPETNRKMVNDPKTPNGVSTAPLMPQNVNISSQRASNMPHFASQGIDPNANAQYAQLQPPLTNHLGPYAGPLPVGATPIGFLPDGSSVVYFNGMSYQCFWDGSSAAMKPLQFPMPNPSLTGFTSTAYPSTAVATHPYGLSSLNVLPLTQGTIDGSNYAQGQHGQLEMANPVDRQALHSQIASELNTLDKHVALHLHEFSQAENSFYTSQRRLLVEQLDNLRVKTENSGPPTSRGVPSYAMQAAPQWTRAYNTARNTSAAQHKAGNIQTTLTNTPAHLEPASSQLSGFSSSSQLAPPQTSLNKCLSPDAPPFVPAGARTAFPDYFGTGQDNSSRNPQNPNDKKSTEHVSNTGFLKFQPFDNVNKENALRSGNGIKSSDITRSCTNSETGGIGTLPTVTLADIEYSNEPGFNPRDGPKIYCTTINEFQEVLRRVREQAELYGCKGGQSKDPAYDAEQDIRWAMADGEPIPLPKSPADHVAHPRPWSWDDSAFNYRPDVAISPIGMNNKFNHDIHQRSRDFTSNTFRQRADSWDSEPDTQNITQELSGMGRSACHPQSAGIKPQQHHPCNEGAPTTPKGSKAHLGHDTSTAGLSERFQSTGQVWTSPNAASYRSGQTTGRFKANRQESVSNDAGCHRNFSGKLNEVQRDYQQKFHQSPNLHRQNPSSTENVTQNLDFWINTSNHKHENSDALSFDSQGIPRSVHHTPNSCGRDSLRAAKVNLPQTHRQSILKQTSQTHPNSATRHVGELPLVNNFAKPPNNTSPEGFLRGMLRSPRYSSAKIHRSEPYHLKHNPMRMTERVSHDQEMRYANKENVKSEGYEDYEAMISKLSRGSSKSSKESTKYRQSTGSDVFVNKARSSLAASNYHAFGHLPQYDGAGDTLLSSNQQARSSNVQVDNSSPKRKDAKYLQTRPSEGGQVESRAEQAKSYQVGRTDSYDYGGLTRNDFMVASDRPSDVRKHGEHVDRYFELLREDELRELSASKDKDPITQRRL